MIGVFFCFFLGFSGLFRCFFLDCFWMFSVCFLDFAVFQFFLIFCIVSVFFAGFVLDVFL